MAPAAGADTRADPLGGPVVEERLDLTPTCAPAPQIAEPEPPC
jgi:hypothetical protein